ncbi:MAG: iron ABC transporter permease, partial [Pseudomonadota bacterium]
DALAGESTPTLPMDDERRRRGRQRRVLGLLLTGLLIGVVLALKTGAVPITWGALVGAEGDAKALLERTVFVEIRSPRVLLAAFVGAALALAGAVLQGLFRNPLADPQLIGVSSGAALGAVAMIVLGEAIAWPLWFAHYAVPASAITGGVLVTAFLYLFSRYFGNFNTVTMILVGIAINALAVVGVGAFEYLSDDTQLRTLVFWMMGSFGRATWPTIIPSLLVICLGAVVLLRLGDRFDLLQLGEEGARHLGVDTRHLTRIAILASAAVVGAGVAVSGIISFLGLVVPHLVRLLGGPSHRYVLPASALLGALMMVMADLLARTLVVPAELPVGLVTSAIGGPFFLWLIARVRMR